MNPLDILRGLRLEDGRSWGEAATPVQVADAEAILDEHAPERFHLVTRARGYSKTSDLGAVALAVLLTQAPAASRSYAVAADRDQARLLLDSMDGFVRRTPGIGRVLTTDAWKVTHTGKRATLEALASDSPTAWGLRPYFAVVDELAVWPETASAKKVWEAISSAVPKTGGRLAAITTAGSPTHWARKVRDHAAESPLWRLSETPGPPPWTPVALLDEQRARLLPSTYARLFENTWAEAEAVLATVDDIRACVRLDGPLPPRPDVRYVVTLDIGITNDRTAAVVAHAEPTYTQVGSLGDAVVTGVDVYVDRLETWEGTRQRPVDLRDVEEYVAATADAYNHAEVVSDPFQWVAAAQRLRGRGLTVTDYTFTAASVARLAAALHRAIRDRALWIPDDERLVSELSRVRLVERGPGQFRIDHAAGEHDDVAIATAMAVAALHDRVTTGPLSASFGSTAAPDVSDVPVRSFDGERTQGGRRDDHLWGRERDEQWWAQFEATL